MKKQKIRKTIIGLMSISTFCFLTDGSCAVSSNCTAGSSKIGWASMKQTDPWILPPASPAVVAEGANAKARSQQDSAELAWADETRRGIGGSRVRKVQQGNSG